MPRRDGRDLARILAKRATGDALALQRLATDPEIPDHILGFHAQQAVEKFLKAVLAAQEVTYGRTHDLGRLIELVDQQGLPAPPDPERLVALTPWATGLRYGEDPVEPEPLDRERSMELVAAVRNWAAGLLGHSNA